jgi:hypothetical protein
MEVNIITEGDNLEEGLPSESIFYDIDNLLNYFGVSLLIFCDFAKDILDIAVFDGWL